MDLVITWAALLGLAVILYVVLDGFSLGIGLLFPFTKDDRERDTLMNSIAPVWDANQTWLVFSGAGLFVAFPMMYGVLFSALYVPLFAFLYGLIFRGVSFEFRINSTRKRKWDRAFFLGSLTAVIAQGLTLGGILSGVRVTGGQFGGGPFDWLNPYSLATAGGLVSGYILLASAFLIIKTTGRVREQASRRAFRSAGIVLVFQVIMIMWTSFHYSGMLQNWLSPPRMYFIWIFPLISLFSFSMIIKSLRAGRETAPFTWSAIFFFAGYLALAASIYPYAVPPRITLHEAAARQETLAFTLWGAALIMPVVLGYTIYSYRVFRGKVDREKTCHD